MASFGQRMSASAVNYSPSPRRVAVTCDSCRRDVELQCAGIAGTAGYETYNEYFCPHCRKLNRARTPGRILAALPAART